MHARRMRWLKIPAVALACIAIVSAFNLVVDRTGPDIDPAVLRNQALPAFSLPGLFGDPAGGFSDADLRSGGVAVINFFASWCIPCLSEHRYVKHLARDHGVRVYGVNLRDDPDQAHRWLRDLGDPYYRVGADPDGAAARRMRVVGIPVTLVVDRAGAIRYRHDGPLDQQTLRQRILPVVQTLIDRPHL